MDSRLKAVDRIIEQAFSQYLNPNGMVSGSEYYVDNNPNTTWKQYLLFHLRHEFGLMQNSDVKYLPIVMRLAYSDEVQFDISNDNGIQIRTLQRIIQQIKKDDTFFQEVKANPNVTFDQLAERFKEQFTQEDTADAEAANSVSGGNSDYEIVEVTDFETAKYYGDYSYSKSLLCYTQNESTWEDYLGRYNRAYVCLRKGWKNIPEEPTEGFPYDLYGTSMIFVFVAPNREIAKSNTRWNHYGEDKLVKKRADDAFTKTMLSQIIGLPFDSVFKPKDVSISTDELISMIENGEYKGLRGLAVGNFSIPEGTSYIGRYAFWGCTKLTSITIPNSVTKIGCSAFFDCSNLTSITIPNSVTTIDGSAFQGCTNLTSITIPNSVTSIGSYAFWGCTNLTSITIPNSVTNIDSYAFCNCSNLTSITIPNSVTYIGTAAFCFCQSLTNITIPNSVTSIGENAFESCSSLTSITIPNSVTNIDSYAFWGCTNLTSITIPNSVTIIGENAFSWCRSLTSITIPNSVTSIGENAFRGCTNLTSITIPNSVTSIGQSAFYNCQSLTSITIPNSVTYMGWGAFVHCTNLTSIIIPDSVTSIGSSTFYGCTNLTSITIPNSVTSIGGQAFYGCSGLTSVTIGNSVTSISNSAFNSCTNLTNVTIPNSVTLIGESAFNYCSSLTSITVESTTPPSLGKYVFYNNADGRKIYVPAESVAAYKAASGWSEHANAIEAM